MLGLRPPGLEVGRAVSSHLSAAVHKTPFISLHIEHFVINPSIPTDYNKKHKINILYLLTRITRCG